MRCPPYPKAGPLDAPVHVHVHVHLRALFMLICSPSCSIDDGSGRSSFLTGRYAMRHGLQKGAINQAQVRTRRRRRRRRRAIPLVISRPCLLPPAYPVNSCCIPISFPISLLSLSPRPPTACVWRINFFISELLSLQNLESTHHPTLQAKGIPVNNTLVSDALQSVGYHTGAVGKWHVGCASWDMTPIYRGFDYYMGFMCTGQIDFLEKTQDGYLDLWEGNSTIGKSGCGGGVIFL